MLHNLVLHFISLSERKYPTINYLINPTTFSKITLTSSWKTIVFLQWYCSTELNTFNLQQSYDCCWKHRSWNCWKLQYDRNLMYAFWPLKLSLMSEPENVGPLNTKAKTKTNAFLLWFIGHKHLKKTSCSLYIKITMVYSKTCCLCIRKWDWSHGTASI